MPPNALYLTELQHRFVEEFHICTNATKAAIRAGYSARTAHAMGHKNMRKPKIRRAIDALEQYRVQSNPRMVDALLIIRSPRFAEIEAILAESRKWEPSDGPRATRIPRA